MKKLLLVGIALLLSFAVLADHTRNTVADSAMITFSVPSPVVADVPFSVDVLVNAANGHTPFTEFDLSFTPAIFTGHQRNLFTVHPSTGIYATGYRYSTTATGITMSSSTSGTTLLFFLDANVQGITPFQVGLDTTQIHTITASIGYDALTVTSTPSASITPAPSVCGDGVVGYFDTGTGANTDNGRQDAGELPEACDSISSGCVGCQYIAIGYKATLCGFGSRTCQVTPLSPRDLLREKLNALLDGTCYPVAPTAHPNPLYCEDSVPTDTDLTKDDFIINYDNPSTTTVNEFTASEKIQFIAQISTALREFFAAVIPVGAST